MSKFYRLANGGWGCDEGGIKFRFFKPSGSSQWKCRAYAYGDQFDEVADTREQGIRYLKVAIGMQQDRNRRKCVNCGADLEQYGTSKGCSACHV